MANKIMYRADSRGAADYGWLKTFYSFSFSNYYNPERIQFGMLRVLNDDTISSAMGFGEHPHENMEIITIVLEGALEHKDSMMNKGVIKPGEVQVMSAGSGIYHSEYNHSQKEEVKLLQIWILAKETDIDPRYDQKAFKEEDKKNTFKVVVSPEKNNGSLWINQDAWLSLGNLDLNAQLNYKVKKQGNGVFVFVIEGEVMVADEKLSKRDAIGIYNTSDIDITAMSDCKVLLIDVPMTMAY